MRNGPRPLTAAQQFANLAADRTFGGHGKLSPGRFEWWFQAQPTAISRVYDLRIDFSRRGPPKTFVVAPDLVELAGGGKLPHVYQQMPTQLCLYFPNAGEWTPSVRISETIPRWAALWLLYFEDWLIDGEWRGGGIHPPPPRVS